MRGRLFQFERSWRGVARRDKIGDGLCAHGMNGGVEKTPKKANLQVLRVERGVICAELGDFEVLVFCLSRKWRRSHHRRKQRHCMYVCMGMCKCVHKCVHVVTTHR